MNKTITSLQAELEELEKRIKAISTAQSNYLTLNAIKEYFEVVQRYLSTLKTDFSNHLVSCEEYSTQIQNLQEQINTISSALANVSQSQELQELNASLILLQSRLEAHEINLSTLNKNINDSFSEVRGSISDVQTDLGYISDQIEEILADISAINATLSDHQTQITNLNATQNTLTTANSTLTAQVSAIDNRLTTAEANIATLTGGVDVGYIDNRLTNLETGAPTAHENYKYNITNGNSTLYTREYSFSCSKDDMLYQKMKLCYTSQGSGTLTLTFYEEQVETTEQIVVDLAKHPYEYEFTRQFFPTKKANNIMIKAVASGTITYESFDLWLFGKNVTLYNYDQEIKVACFNDNIYITRYYDDCIKYGMFASTDTIDLDNLPLSRSYNQNSGGNTYALYGPLLKPSQGRYELEEECMMYRVLSNINQHGLEFTSNNTYRGTMGAMSASGVYCGFTTYPFTAYIRNSLPKLATIYVNNGQTSFNDTNLTQRQTGEWLYIAATINQYNKLDSNTQQYYSVQDLILNENGYFYLVNGFNATNVLQIGKGTHATSFLQPDNSINVYLTNNGNVDKYTLTQQSNGTYTCAFAETIPDCLIFNEVMGLYTLKLTKTGWVFEPIIRDEITPVPEDEQPPESE